MATNPILVHQAHSDVDRAMHAPQDLMVIPVVVAIILQSKNRLVIDVQTRSLTQEQLTKPRMFRQIKRQLTAK